MKMPKNLTSELCHVELDSLAAKKMLQVIQWKARIRPQLRAVKINVPEGARNQGLLVRSTTLILCMVIDIELVPQPEEAESLCGRLSSAVQEGGYEHASRCVGSAPGSLLRNLSESSVNIQQEWANIKIVYANVHYEQAGNLMIEQAP
ncbi:hypothetical protein cyc_06386 [Cyclospora cayetanensis]|uniref:Uncharacterized protein n=1 Tax=Cyclospora cayetanensis TaxID=88456 RepID=A0A1D3DAH4_9EIME|nr:hypothetical protein cyc_06386 [Cyclospora cayetanensis]